MALLFARVEVKNSLKEEKMKIKPQHFMVINSAHKEFPREIIRLLFSHLLRKKTIRDLWGNVEKHFSLFFVCISFESREFKSLSVPYTSCLLSIMSS